MNLHSTEEFLSLLFDYLSSRRWWCIPGGGSGMEIIETTFYGGKKNAGFHVLMGPVPPQYGSGTLVVAFALKKHMSRTQVKKLTGVMPDKEQDILLIITPDAEESQMAIALSILSEIYSDQKALRN